MEEIQRKWLLRTGLISSGLVALCCITPILVLLLGVVGLGAISYLDYVLFPALAVFLGLALYAEAHQRQAMGGACCTPHESERRER